MNESALTPVFGTVSSPPSVVAGVKLTAKVPVIVTNRGGSLKGMVTVKIYADTGDSLDGSQVLVTSQEKFLSLHSEKAHTFTFNVRSLPSGLPVGTFHLLAEVIDPSGKTNVAATTQTVTVAAAFISPMASAGAVHPASIPIGKSGSILITVTNIGNVPASGVGITISPSADGISPVAGVILESLRSGARILPNKSKTFRLRFKVTDALMAANYYPYLSVSLGGVPTTEVGTTQFTVV